MRFYLARLLRQFRPPHGWRAFLVEIVIVVIGVLVALSAQQVLSSLHDATLRDEARTAIDGELGQNLDGFRRRAEVQRCVATRLDELERLIVRTPRGTLLPRPLWVGRPQVWVVATNVWEVTSSGARTTLLSFEQQHAYAQIYGLLKVFDAAEEREQDAWARLRVLEIAPTLDSAGRQAAFEALQQARYADFRINVAAAQSRDLAATMGLKPQRTRYGQGSRSVCIPLSTPRSVALKRIFDGQTLRFEP